MSAKVVDIPGDGVNAIGVTLENGLNIMADLILLGAGVFPSTQFLSSSTL